MAARLPPLNTLRGFEAAARHLSFTKAAEELHVTQAAVSHQIKALEDWLGVKLFRRLNRALRLTDAGQAYLPPVSDALERLALATEAVRKGEGAGPLRITVLPSFGARWLLPRLPRFRARHPEIDVLIDASIALTDFNRGDMDLGIRFGFGDYPGLFAERLMGDQVFPVCSPTLVQGPNPLRSPADLTLHTLVHDDSPGHPEYAGWRDWLQAADAATVDPTRGLTFSDSSMALQAAVDGQGVALARLSLVAGELAAGRLIEPFDLRLKSKAAYFVVVPEVGADRPKVRLFRDWLSEEAAADPELGVCAPPPEMAERPRGGRGLASSS